MARLVELAVAIEAVDVEAADLAGLASLITSMSAARAALDGLEISVGLRVAAAASGGVAARAAAVTEALADGGRRSTSAARAATRRVAVCGRMPAVHEALTAGAISAGHVDAIASAMRGMDEARAAEYAAFADELVVSATAKPVVEVERECRDLAGYLAYGDDVDPVDAQRRDRSCRTWIDKVTGMHQVHAALDAVAGQRVFTALHAATATACQRLGDGQEPLERVRADAFTELVTGAGSGSGMRVPEVAVLIDQRTLLDEWHAGSLCETVDGVAVPVATVRRWCCDADVLPIVLGGDGEPLDCGRTRRTANRAQRRALAALYRTCAAPGCDIGFSACEVHHVVWWERRGPTDFSNLVPVCARHHHLIHEGGWTLTMTTDRVVTLSRADGTIAGRARTCDRRPSGVVVPTTTEALHRERRRHRTGHGDPPCEPEMERASDGEPTAEVAA